MREAAQLIRDDELTDEWVQRATSLCERIEAAIAEFDLEPIEED